MPRTRRAVRAASLPIALLAAAALAGCGAAPDPSASGTASASDYCARMVTNSGGLQDRSFNQSSWEGLERAEQELGIEADVLVSTSETDLGPNVVTIAIGMSSMRATSFCRCSCSLIGCPSRSETWDLPRTGGRHALSRCSRRSRR